MATVPAYGRRFPIPATRHYYAKQGSVKYWEEGLETHWFEDDCDSDDGPDGVHGDEAVAPTCEPDVLPVDMLDLLEASAMALALKRSRADMNKGKEDATNSTVTSTTSDDDTCDSFSSSDDCYSANTSRDAGPGAFKSSPVSNHARRLGLVESLLSHLKENPLRTHHSPPTTLSLSHQTLLNELADRYKDSIIFSRTFPPRCLVTFNTGARICITWSEQTQKFEVLLPPSLASIMDLKNQVLTILSDSAENSSIHDRLFHAEALIATYGLIGSSEKSQPTSAWRQFGDKLGWTSSLVTMEELGERRRAIEEELSDRYGIDIAAMRLILRTNGWSKSSSRNFIEQLNEPKSFSNKFDENIAPTTHGECMVCFDSDVDLLSSTTLRCGHTICHDCTNGLLTSAINNADISPRCGSCPEIIDYITLVASGFEPRFETLLTNKYSDGFRWISHHSCPMMALCGKGNQVATCSKCHIYSACVSCGGIPHWPATCETMKKFNDTFGKLADVRQPLHRPDLEIMTKPCPNCKYEIEKGEGCSHMTCSRCLHEFCWVCAVKWDTEHYRRGSEVCKPKPRTSVWVFISNVEVEREVVSYEANRSLKNLKNLVLSHKTMNELSTVALVVRASSLVLSALSGGGRSLMVSGPFAGLAARIRFALDVFEKDNDQVTLLNNLVEVAKELKTALKKRPQLY